MLRKFTPSGSLKKSSFFKKNFVLYPSKRLFEVNRRAIHIFRPRGFVPLDHLEEGLVYLSSLSLQQGDFSTAGMLQRGKGTLPAGINS